MTRCELAGHDCIAVVKLVLAADIMKHESWPSTPVASRYRNHVTSGQGVGGDGDGDGEADTAIDLVGVTVNKTMEGDFDADGVGEGMSYSHSRSKLIECPLS